MALWPSLLSKTSSVLVFGFVALNCFVGDRFGSHAQGLITPLLPLHEVQILQNISDKLNINNWATINRTSCGMAEWWNYTTTDNNTQSIVKCNCTFENGSVCHVTNIRVKRFDLNGVLPEELGDLPELVEMQVMSAFSTILSQVH
uniref:Leucine-rich repeat-containing N-terminal plant-type domain-containing protein n=1 Tax=Salix viminalis TaxID=40686 RepID=A0A6N2KNT2_SALVM